MELFSRTYLLLLAGLAEAQTPAAVRLLETRCVGCHNRQNQQSGLDLSRRESAIRGGDRGPGMVPGKSKESLLYQVVAQTAKPAMPKVGAKLSEAELALVADWIDQGALWEQPILSSAPPKPEHWAFKLPVRATPPAPVNASWGRNPIDAFLAAEHERRQLTPMPPADRRTLLRRAYLDVVGVPPTPAEIERFVKDPSPTAYEQVIDQLLADPRYGERWGRHWMDIWRYSDWYGYRSGNDVRNSHKFVWRWRDWIVESLNADKSYDRMIVEMLAGDEVAPDDPNTLRATGFLARNYSKYDRDGWMQDAVDHTSLAFLGVTVKCARCHNHKYDPVSQNEYYRLRAFFEPYEVRIDRVAGQVDTDKDGLARIFDAALDRPTYLLIRGNIQTPDKSNALTPATPAHLGPAVGKMTPVPLPLSAYYPDQRAFVATDLLAQAKAALTKAEGELRKQEESYAAVEKELADGTVKTGYAKMRQATDQVELARKTLAAAQADLPALEARVAADRAKYAEPPDPRYEDLAATARAAERQAGILKGDEHLLRAQLELAEAVGTPDPKTGKPHEKKIAEAKKKLATATTALAQPATGYTPIGQEYPTKSTGRRTALAQWIASTQNPLTARVAVNHLWLRHFGSALVPTVFDFGLNGRAPTHPALLDWLATELMRTGWSMKKMHRLMLMSQAYQMRSTSGDAQHPNAKIDPENRLLWRMNPRRLEAEAVRDSILSVAGELDPVMGGPEIDTAKGFESRRRSLYFSHSPDAQMEFLKVFDGANPTECYQREESVVPQQALAMANSQLSQQMADLLTKRLEGPQFVERAFATILGRPPSPAELTLAATAPPRNLVHALFNHNDFVTIR